MDTLHPPPPTANLPLNKTKIFVYKSEILIKYYERLVLAALKARSTRLGYSRKSEDLKKILYLKKISDLKKYLRFEKNLRSHKNSQKKCRLISQKNITFQKKSQI